MPGRRLRARGGRYRAAAAFALIALLARPGRSASLSPQDLQVLGNALAFAQPHTSAGTVAVVYAGRDSASRQDAAEILAAIGPGLKTSGVVLTPRLVAAEELATTEFDLVIVAAGANSEPVLRAARAHHALCVTGDRAAVRDGVCAMAIASTGRRVEILLNSRALQALGVSFATAFRMMVQEL